MLAEFLFLLQILQDAREELRVFAAHLADGLAAAGGFAVFVLRGVEASLIYFKALFTRNVARDFKRQAIGCIKIESAATVKRGLFLFAKLGE